MTQEISSIGIENSNTKSKVPVNLSMDSANKWNEYFIFCVDSIENLNARDIRLAASIADIMFEEYISRTAVVEYYE